MCTLTKLTISVKTDVEAIKLNDVVLVVIAAILHYSLLQISNEQTVSLSTATARRDNLFAKDANSVPMVLHKLE